MPWQFYEYPCFETGEVLVGWGSGRTGTQEAELVTEGLACCIGLAIYDPATTRGYLAHLLPTISNHRDVATPMVEKAVELTDDASKLRAWLRGGTPEHFPHGGDKYRVHGEVLSLLGAAGLSSNNTDVQWNEDGNYSITMTLSCMTGEVTATAI